MSKEIYWYETVSGRQPFGEWLFGIKDQTVVQSILARLDRLINGNFGDVQSVGAGVSELRFHFGAGIRVYFALDGSHIILLLCAGDKSSQKKDIKNAKVYWQDYLRRNYESGS